MVHSASWVQLSSYFERKSSGSCLESREYCRRYPSRWSRGTLYPQKVGTNFADNRRSLGRYSSLSYSDHGVCLYSQKPQQSLNLLVTEERYWALFYMPLYSHTGFSPFYHGEVLQSTPLPALDSQHTIFQLYCVCIQIANKLGNLKKHAIVYVSTQFAECIGTDCK
jgi:hypothetical protein